MAKESQKKLSNVPVLSVQKIKESQKNKAIEEFLLAKNIDFWLAEKGITPAIDSIYDGFKREYQNSEYLTPLEKKYSEFFAISSGQPAPEITGVTISGDTITLSSLKGKVVYVDVGQHGVARVLLNFHTIHRFKRNLKTTEMSSSCLFPKIPKKIKGKIMLKTK